METSELADLVERSVRLLDEARLTDAEFQGASNALYDFQSHYAARPTYFRVMEVLERRGVFVTVELDRHPDWESGGAEVFGTDDGASVSPVFRKPSEEWSESDNPVVGYAADETLYLRRGGELWERLVEEEILEGDAIDPPIEVSLFDAVAEVCGRARDEDDLDTILEWYVGLGFHLGFEARDDETDRATVEELRTDEGVAVIREIVGDIDNLEFQIAHPERGLEVPPPALREAHPVLSWWYDLL